MLVRRYQRREAQHEAIGSLPLYPDEVVPWDSAQLPDLDHTGDSCLALPKLNLQFLTLNDYLLRNFNLFRLEATYDIKQDIEDAVTCATPLNPRARPPHPARPPALLAARHHCAHPVPFSPTPSSPSCSPPFSPFLLPLPLPGACSRAS